jgi:putative IMPACT (imprinted ancient) family translation regulator
VTSVADADAHLRSVRAQHPGARHHCTALVLEADAGDGAVGSGGAPVHRSNDDREPGGTAGVPILQALLHAELVDTFAVVTRYFGGVKLGAGGLVRAYTAAVEHAVAEADARGLLRRRVQLVQVQLEVPFTDVGLAENAVRSWADAHATFGTRVLPSRYGERGATLTVELLPELEAEFAADVGAWSQGRFTQHAAGTVRAELTI